MRGGASRLSGAGPFPVMQVQSRTQWPGGAANVACNVAAFGAECHLFGVLGCDHNGDELSRLLAARAVRVRAVRCDRPTTVKTRYQVKQQYLLQADTVCEESIYPAVEEAVLENFLNSIPGAGAVICSDYGLGCLTEGLMQSIILECKRRRIFVAVDPKLGRTMARGASLLTPNRAEAFAMVGARDPGAEKSPAADAALIAVAEKIMRSRGVAKLLVTLSEDGMVLFRRKDRPFHVRAEGPELVDILGAGDTVVAAFSTAIAAGASDQEATEFASRAAGIVVGKLGCAVASREEMAL